MSDDSTLQIGTVYQRWWPLALSWMMMAVAVPLILAMIGRFPDQEIHLSAYGSFALPIGLFFEAPVLMLLAASTALCKNRAAHRRVWRFMMWSAAVLTTLHALVAFTPLSYVVLQDLMDAEQQLVEPARIGLMISLPWTWAIAYRRFHQGVLIRFGHSKAVGAGAIVRVGTVVICLGIGYYLLHNTGLEPSGVVVGTGAHAMGVVVEAVFIGLWAWPVRRRQFYRGESSGEAPSWSEFFRFYVPLAMTSMISLAGRPLYSAGMTMMPEERASLAAFPVVLGLLWPLRSAGMAFKEVVVALLEEPGSTAVLKQFTIYLVTGVTALLVVVAATPLSGLFFNDLANLKPELLGLAEGGLWIVAIVPGLTVLMNWYQGQIVFGGDTLGITESVVVNLVTVGLILAAGVWLVPVTGFYVALIAMTAGYLLQTVWLWFRSRDVDAS
jgi:hypothetical protein